MLKLQIIIGSTRAGRNVDAVVRWLTPIVQQNSSFELETLDLRDWPLPFFQENPMAMGDLRNPTYSDPIVKRWNDKIKEADAFLFVTPEYNHSTSGVLKNAIDSVFFSFGFRHKAVAFVSYSAGAAGGVRAIEHLQQIMLEAEASPIRTPTIIPFVLQAFDAEGKAANAMVDATARIMLEDLAWLANAMKNARAEGELPPAQGRMRAATAKK